MMVEQNSWNGLSSDKDPENNYFDQFNNCKHITNHFRYFSVPEAALLWCGVTSDELPEFLAQCAPKGDKNGQQKNTFVHPYIRCVEPRCVILHTAFDNGLLKMARDGGKSDYICGTKENTDNYSGGIGHIAHDRRTIYINDLKEFIKEYHPDDMPKNLFSDIDINQAKPISHEDYLTLTARNDALAEQNRQLQARIDKATEIYHQQQAIIKDLQIGTSGIKPITNPTERNKVTQIVQALASMARLPLDNPYTAYQKLQTHAQQQGLELPSKDVFKKWLAPDDNSS